jgi:hypothetical protein
VVDVAEGDALIWLQTLRCICTIPLVDNEEARAIHPSPVVGVVVSNLLASFLEVNHLEVLDQVGGQGGNLLLVCLLVQ